MKKDISYSVLELAIIGENKTLASTLAHTVELAKSAEKAGYKRFWLAEHHNSKAIGSSATSILIGKVADHTKSIRVGSGGIMLPNHSPLIIAEQFGTLGTLYPNRIDLGLGRAPGTDQETARAIKSDFYQAAMSFPQEVEKIEHYFAPQMDNVKVRANVAEGVSVPIYILGSSLDSAHLAAKKGLPYAFASHFATQHLMNAMETYHREFQPSKILSAPYTLAGVNIIVADTDEEAERISTTLYKMIISLLTGKRGFMEPAAEMTPQLREMKNHPSVQNMLKYSFIGSKATVKREIKEFLNTTQVNELIAVTNTYDYNDRIKSYNYFAEIMKEINEED